MKRFAYSALASVALLMAGCDAASLASIKAGLPASSATGSAAAPVIGAAPAAGTGASSTALTKGKKWTYSMVNKSSLANVVGTFSVEVTDVTGDTATIVTTAIMPPAPTQTNTTKVKLTDTDPLSKTMPNMSSDLGQAVTSNEKVTVPAGTYDCVKSIYTKKDDKSEVTLTIWTAKDVGAVKEVMVTKPLVTIPAGIPGMANMDLTSTTTVELTEVK